MPKTTEKKTKLFDSMIKNEQNATVEEQKQACPRRTYSPIKVMLFVVAERIRVR